MKKKIHYLRYFLLCVLGLVHNVFASQTAYYEALGVFVEPYIQVIFPYNLHPDYVTTVLVDQPSGASATQSSNTAVLQTGTGTAGSALLETDQPLPYRSGQANMVICGALFSAGVADNTQIVGVGNSVNGFFFGYNGASFGILHRNNSVDTWIDYTNWNNDPLDGSGSSGVTLDPTQGNVYKIEYQWSGFGAIKFYVAESSTGTFILVHTIRYANLATVVSLTDASMRLMAVTTNTGSAVNTTLTIAGMAGFIAGKKNNFVDSRFSITTNRTVNASEDNFMAIHNNPIFQSVSHHVTVQLDYLTIMNTDTTSNIMIVRLYKNPTLSAALTYTSVDTARSVMEYDITSGASVSGAGTLIATFQCTQSSRVQYINLYDMEIDLAPDDVIVVTMQTGGGTDAVYAALSWRESF